MQQLRRRRVADDPFDVGDDQIEVVGEPGHADVQAWRCEGEGFVDEGDGWQAEEAVAGEAGFAETGEIEGAESAAEEGVHHPAADRMRADSTQCAGILHDEGDLQLHVLEELVAQVPRDLGGGLGQILSGRKAHEREMVEEELFPFLAGEAISGGSEDQTLLAGQRRLGDGLAQGGDRPRGGGGENDRHADLFAGSACEGRRFLGGHRVVLKADSAGQAPRRHVQPANAMLVETMQIARERSAGNQASFPVIEMGRLGLADAPDDVVELAAPGQIDQAEDRLGAEGVEEAVIEQQSQPRPSPADAHQQTSDMLPSGVERNVHVIVEETFGVGGAFFRQIHDAQGDLRDGGLWRGFPIRGEIEPVPRDPAVNEGNAMGNLFERGAKGRFVDVSVEFDDRLGKPPRPMALRAL